MNINGEQINGAVLNGASALHLVTEPEPQPITGGHAFYWHLELLIGDQDRSDWLHGQPTTDRERGSAALCDFALHVPESEGSYNPSEWRGKTVRLNYVSTGMDGITVSARRFTGRIITPSWDGTRRLVSCQCSDQLQQRAEALSIEQIDTLTPGAIWTQDVFSPLAGRSHWEYLQERLSTIPASVDADVYGDIRLTPWFSDAPAWRFGPDTTLYDTASNTYADLDQLINVVELTVAVRFARLRQLNKSYYWQHLDTAGQTGLPGFCVWRGNSGELPNIEMVQAAVEGSGQTIINPNWYRLPPSTPNPCGTGIPWINNFPSLLLGGSWVGARRWSQTVTETYTLRLEAPASIEDVGEVYSRDSASYEVETERSTAWESDPITDGITGHEDILDEPRRQLVIRCMLARGRVEILRAHNQTLVTWREPTSMVLGVELGQTLFIEDQGYLARARCCRIVDEFDLSGAPVTTLTIALMRLGGEASDPLIPPAHSYEPQPEPEPMNPIAQSLPTQMGRRPGLPEYDEELDGFSGNYDNFDPVLDAFPRRFQLTAPEIAAELRDELKVAIAATYRVSADSDPLELS
ncbi:hypothetical protein VUJ49_22695 [Pseudomonas berkeleyensis]|uniref:Uncharacterized protein n=1 Tax=Pseudomonas berkeleyensis TaxID=2726956 RepID=A0A7G5DM06_9PSED|nr:hypothetical protein [Pseudomonas berkeleyensis]QMV62781.1 hypothetical protein HS968_22600 [Pseudomonas berkeleyensis]WSO38231.1 hypothetical protein VUJ49_22695 [Pseudomonas berkeleyensis]